MKKIISFFFFFVLGINLPLSAQTTLAKGDIVLLGINACFNNHCKKKNHNEIDDKIYLVPLDHLRQGTSFIITDNGWERVNDNYFGTTEGVLRFTSRKYIKKGTVIALNIIPNSDKNKLEKVNPDWKVEVLNGNNNNFDFAQHDQFFLVDGKNQWSNNGNHKGNLKDKPYLFAFNNKIVWKGKTGSSNDSSLPDENPNNDNKKDLRNFHLSLLAEKKEDFKHYHYYNGPKTSTSRNQWMIRLLNPNNWKTEESHNEFDNNFKPENLEVNDLIGEIKVCEGENITLEIEKDGEKSIQEVVGWYKSTVNTLSNPTEISSSTSNLLTIQANETGTFFYFAKIKYTLNHKKNQDGTIQSNSAVVNSGYYRVIVNKSVETTPIEQIN